MDIDTCTAGALSVAGLAIRTSPQGAATDIPALWQRFLGEGWLARLPRRDDDPHLYAVYCDYASDASGPYTMVLGVAVAGDAPLPEGTRRVDVPAGRCARLRVTGDPAQVVWAAWQYLNTTWDGRAGRRYAADIERYPLAGLAAATAVDVEIRVGVR